jgi:hypothetical protein
VRQLQCPEYCVGWLEEATDGEASFFRAVGRLVVFFSSKKRQQTVEFFFVSRVATEEGSSMISKSKR